MSGILSSLKNMNPFKEEFAQTWTLLNDTENFLKSFSLFDEYESRLKTWRQSLNASSHTQSDVHEIRSQIIAFRKELRLLGYDLRLGAMNIVTVGSKSDDAPRYGFRRASIILARPKISWLTGEENHNELMRHLVALCGEVNYSFLHNIWFRWNGKVLEIAAADSEGSEQFVKLKDFIAANKLYALSSLRNLR